MADTPSGETNQEPLSTEVTPTAPIVDNGTQAADADAQKKAQQLEMERNLLRKRLDEANRQLEEKTRKELEEKEDYRSLAERAQAEADALRKEKADAENAQARKLTTETVYAGFDAKVVEVAKAAGLTATDDSDEAQAALRAKLESIQTSIGVTKQPTASANNPAPVVQTQPEKQQLLERMRWDNPQLRNAAVKSAVGNLETIQAMKTASGRTAQEI